MTLAAQQAIGIQWEAIPARSARVAAADEATPETFATSIRLATVATTYLQPHVGGIPVLEYTIANIIDSEDIGAHTYDSGYVHIPRAGGGLPTTLSIAKTMASSTPAEVVSSTPLASGTTSTGPSTSPSRLARG